MRMVEGLKPRKGFAHMATPLRYREELREQASRLVQDRLQMAHDLGALHVVLDGRSAEDDASL
jgi:hypothetical protein